MENELNAEPNQIASGETSEQESSSKDGEHMASTIKKIEQRMQVPACVFPRRNIVTGNIVWFEIGPIGEYGVYVTVHKERPILDRPAQDSPETSMATARVDYYGENDQVVLCPWDEQSDHRYGPPEWNIPGEESKRVDTAILLVSNVQQWLAPVEQKDITGEQDEKK